MIHQAKLKAFDAFATYGTLLYAIGVVALWMAVLPYALIPFGSLLGIVPWVTTVNRWHKQLVHGEQKNGQHPHTACDGCEPWCLASTDLDYRCVCKCQRQHAGGEL